jgi:prepilin-type N-terminal cleavage/methylation domain-containing protein
MNNKGFTLVELLMASAVFSIVVVIISGIFVAAVNTQRNILSAKKVLGQTSYAMEFMSRALRMAVKDTGQGCITAGYNYDYHPTYGNQGIRFKNHLQGDECQEFYLEGGQIKFKRNASSPTPQVLDLTSSDMEITDLRFFLSGETQNDDLQPMVTIYLEAKTGDSPTIKLQTSISQRNLDVSY